MSHNRKIMEHRFLKHLGPCPVQWGFSHVDRHPYHSAVSSREEGPIWAVVSWLWCLFGFHWYKMRNEETPCSVVSKSKQAFSFTVTVFWWFELFWLNVFTKIHCHYDGTCNIGFCCWTKIWLLSWEWDNHAWWETCIYEIMTTIFFKDFVRQILEGKNQQLPPNLTTESKMIRGLFEFNLTGVSGIPKHFCHIGYNPSFEGCDSDLFGVFKLKLILQIDFFKHILSFKFVQCFTNQPFVPADCDARFFWGWKIPTKRGRWKTWMMPCKWSVALGIFMGPSYQWRKGRGYAANRDLWDLIFLKLLWVIWVDCHLVRNQAFKDIKLRSDKTVRVQRPGIGNMVSFPEIAGHSCRFLKKTWTAK